MSTAEARDDERDDQLFLIHAAFSIDHERVADKRWFLMIDPVIAGHACMVRGGDGLAAGCESRMARPDGDVPPAIVLAAIRNLAPVCGDAMVDDLLATGSVAPADFAPWFRGHFPHGLVVAGRSTVDWDWETATVPADRLVLFGWPLVEAPGCRRDAEGGFCVDA